MTVVTDEKIPFSVSICVYKNDKPEHFKTALDSIKNQTMKPNEIVLVVDGPITDELESVIDKFTESGLLKLIRLSQNVGHGNARRIGLENCSNEIVALMDADDISVQERFEKQIKCFIDEIDLSIVGGYIKEFVESASNVVGIREVPTDDADIKKFMKKRCPFNQVTVMFRASDVKAAGGYQDWYCNEDYYLWLRMYQCGAKFKNLESCLVNVRVGKDMYKRRGGWLYFKSEAKLQNFMYANRIISIGRFCINVSIRFIMQVILPSQIRGFLFQKLARRKISV